MKLARLAPYIAVAFLTVIFGWLTFEATTCDRVSQAFAQFSGTYAPMPTPNMPHGMTGTQFRQTLDEMFGQVGGTYPIAPVLLPGTKLFGLPVATIGATPANGTYIGVSGGQIVPTSGPTPLASFPLASSVSAANHQINLLATDSATGDALSRNQSSINSLALPTGPANFNSQRIGSVGLDTTTGDALSRLQSNLASLAPVTVTTITSTPYNWTGTAPYAILLDSCAAGSHSIVLPPAVGTGQWLRIVKTDSSANTLSITAGTTINGSASAQVLTTYSFIELHDDVSGNWSASTITAGGGGGSSFPLTANVSAASHQINLVGADAATGDALSRNQSTLASLATILPTVISTTPFTIVSTATYQNYLDSAAAGNRAITVPAPTASGIWIRITKDDTSANTLTLTPASGLINGAATLVMTAYSTVELHDDLSGDWSATALPPTAGGGSSFPLGGNVSAASHIIQNLGSDASTGDALSRLQSTMASLAATVPTVITTTPYTIASTATYQAYSDTAAAGARGITLPAATGTAKWIRIVKSDTSSNILTITPNGSDTINGGATLILSAFSSVDLRDDGTGLWSANLSSSFPLVGNVSAASHQINLLAADTTTGDALSRGQSTLNSLNSPTGTFSFNTQRLSSLATDTTTGDALSRGQSNLASLAALTATIIGTTPYTIASTAPPYQVYSDTEAAGARVINLPAATGSGVWLRIIKPDATSNALTINATSAQTINGTTPLVLTTPGSIDLHDDGTGTWSANLAGNGGGSAFPLSSNVSAANNQINLLKTGAVAGDAISVSQPAPTFGHFMAGATVGFPTVNSTAATSDLFQAATGAQNGDLELLAFSLVSCTPGAIVAPASGGWTPVHAAVTNGTNISLNVYQRIYSSTTPGPYSFSWTGSCKAYGQVTDLKNPAGTPVDFSAPSTSSSAASTFALAGGTAASLNDEVFYFAAQDGGNATLNLTTVLAAGSGGVWDIGNNGIGAWHTIPLSTTAPGVNFSSSASGNWAGLTVGLTLGSNATARAILQNAFNAKLASLRAAVNGNLDLVAEFGAPIYPLPGAYFNQLQFDSAPAFQAALDYACSQWQGPNVPTNVPAINLGADLYIIFEPLLTDCGAGAQANNSSALPIQINGSGDFTSQIINNSGGPAMYVIGGQFNSGRVTVGSTLFTTTHGGKSIIFTTSAGGQVFLDLTPAIISDFAGNLVKDQPLNGQSTGLGVRFPFVPNSANSGNTQSLVCSGGIIDQFKPRPLGASWASEGTYCLQIDSSNKLHAYLHTVNGYYNVASAAAVTFSGATQEAELSYNNTNLYVCLNGTCASVAATGNLVQNPGEIQTVGADVTELPWGSMENQYEGSLGSLDIESAAVHTANYTESTAEYASGSNTILLTYFGNVTYARPTVSGWTTKPVLFGADFVHNQNYEPGNGNQIWLPLRDLTPSSPETTLNIHDVGFFGGYSAIDTDWANVHADNIAVGSVFNGIVTSPNGSYDSWVHGLINTSYSPAGWPLIFGESTSDARDVESLCGVGCLYTGGGEISNSYFETGTGNAWGLVANGAGHFSQVIEDSENGGTFAALTCIEPASGTFGAGCSIDSSSNLVSQGNSATIVLEGGGELGAVPTLNIANSVLSENAGYPVVDTTWANGNQENGGGDRGKIIFLNDIIYGPNNSSGQAQWFVNNGYPFEVDGSGALTYDTQRSADALGTSYTNPLVSYNSGFASATSLNIWPPLNTPPGVLLSATVLNPTTTAAVPPAGWTQDGVSTVSGQSTLATFHHVYSLTDSLPYVFGVNNSNYSVYVDVSVPGADPVNPLDKYTAAGSAGPITTITTPSLSGLSTNNDIVFNFGYQYQCQGNNSVGGWSVTGAPTNASGWITAGTNVGTQNIIGLGWTENGAVAVTNASYSFGGTLTVISTNGFPTTGTLAIEDNNGTNTVTLNYTGITTTTFTGVTTTAVASSNNVSSSISTGAIVTLLGSTASPGLTINCNEAYGASDVYVSEAVAYRPRNSTGGGQVITQNENEATLGNLNNLFNPASGLYGADPTGTRDSGTAITNAIAAASSYASIGYSPARFPASVKLPAGRYILHEPILVSGSMQVAQTGAPSEFSGAGEYATALVSGMAGGPILAAMSMSSIYTGNNGHPLVATALVTGSGGSIQWSNNSGNYSIDVELLTGIQPVNGDATFSTSGQYNPTNAAGANEVLISSSGGVDSRKCAVLGTGDALSGGCKGAFTTWRGTDGKLHCNVNLSTSGQIAAVSAAAFTVGAANEFVCDYNGADLYAELNGTSSAGTAGTGTIVQGPAEKTLIGGIVQQFQWSGWTYFPAGSLDSVEIASTARCGVSARSGVACGSNYTKHTAVYAGDANSVVLFPGFGTNLTVPAVEVNSGGPWQWAFGPSYLKGSAINETSSFAWVPPTFTGIGCCGGSIVIHDMYLLSGTDAIASNVSAIHGYNIAYEGQSYNGIETTPSSYNSSFQNIDVPATNAAAPALSPLVLGGGISTVDNLHVPSMGVMGPFLGGSKITNSYWAPGSGTLWGFICDGGCVLDWDNEDTENGGNVLGGLLWQDPGQGSGIMTIANTVIAQTGTGIPPLRIECNSNLDLVLDHDQMNVNNSQTTEVDSTYCNNDQGTAPIDFIDPILSDGASGELPPTGATWVSNFSNGEPQPFRVRGAVDIPPVYVSGQLNNRIPTSTTPIASVYVSDATACTPGTTLTGGGSTFCLLNWNGSAWKETGITWYVGD